jgi:hypothetical protein
MRAILCSSSFFHSSIVIPPFPTGFVQGFARPLPIPSSPALSVSRQFTQISSNSDDEYENLVTCDGWVFMRDFFLTVPYCAPVSQQHLLDVRRILLCRLQIYTILLSQHIEIRSHDHCAVEQIEIVELWIQCILNNRIYALKK